MSLHSECSYFRLWTWTEIIFFFFTMIAFSIESLIIIVVILDNAVMGLRFFIFLSMYLITLCVNILRFLLLILTLWILSIIFLSVQFMVSIVVIGSRGGFPQIQGLVGTNVNLAYSVQIPVRLLHRSVSVLKPRNICIFCMLAIINHFVILNSIEVILWVRVSLSLTGVAPSSFVIKWVRSTTDHDYFCLIK